MSTTTAQPQGTRKANRLLRAFRSPLGAGAGLALLVIIFLAIFAPILWGEQAAQTDTSNILKGPSLEHWAGTDALGRDLFLRVLVATRLTLLLTLESTAIGLTLGLLLGSAPIILGRQLGKAVNWFIGIAVAFPGLLLAMFFAVIFGTGANSAALALGLASSPGFARLCQTLIASILGRDFIAAAQIGGVGRFRILIRHVLPNIGEPLVVNATVGMGGTLLSFAGLSFLGIGVQAPDFDWGRLMMECLLSIFVHPVASLVPGIAIVIACLAFNLTGETIAHALGVASIGDLGVRGRWQRRQARLAALTPAGTPGAADDPAPQDAVLSLRGLRVSFPAGRRDITPVRGVGFDIRQGEALGLVGESGSGKSLTALAVAQLIEEPGRVEAGRLDFGGQDFRAGAKTTAQRHFLGSNLAMVFQDPMTSLNPTQKVGRQLAELATEHGGYSKKAALERAVERLSAVRITDAEHRAKQYPHEFSGGMRQRAMIGLGVMLTPQLIIADEPTTALDVTVQEQVLDLLQSIRRTDGVALLLISHDVSVVAEVCDRVMVMYAGRIVEDLPVASLRTQAAHPYTRLLIAAVPTMSTDLAAPLATIPGRPVEPADVPPGCAFAARCPLADDRCRAQDAELAEWGEGHRVACWHAGEALPAFSGDLEEER